MLKQQFKAPCWKKTNKLFKNAPQNVGNAIKSNQQKVQSARKHNKRDNTSKHTKHRKNIKLKPEEIYLRFKQHVSSINLSDVSKILNNLSNTASVKPEYRHTSSSPEYFIPTKKRIIRNRGISFNTPLKQPPSYSTYVRKDDDFQNTTNDKQTNFHLETWRRNGIIQHSSRFIPIHASNFKEKKVEILPKKTKRKLKQPKKFEYQTFNNIARWNNNNEQLLKKENEIEIDRWPNNNDKNNIIPFSKCGYNTHVLLLKSNQNEITKPTKLPFDETKLLHTFNKLSRGLDDIAKTRKIPSKFVQDITDESLKKPHEKNLASFYKQKIKETKKTQQIDRARKRHKLQNIQKKRNLIKKGITSQSIADEFIKQDKRLRHGKKLWFKILYTAKATQMFKETYMNQFQDTHQELRQKILARMVMRKIKQTNDEIERTQESKVTPQQNAADIIVHQLALDKPQNFFRNAFSRYKNHVSGVSSTVAKQQKYYFAMTMRLKLLIHKIVTIRSARIELLVNQLEFAEFHASKIWISDKNETEQLTPEMIRDIAKKEGYPFLDKSILHNMAKELYRKSLLSHWHEFKRNYMIMEGLKIRIKCVKQIFNVYGLSFEESQILSMYEDYYHLKNNASSVSGHIVRDYDFAIYILENNNIKSESAVVETYYNILLQRHINRYKNVVNNEELSKKLEMEVNVHKPTLTTIRSIKISFKTSRSWLDIADTLQQTLSSYNIVQQLSSEHRNKLLNVFVKMKNIGVSRKSYLKIKSHSRKSLTLDKRIIW